MIRKLSVADYVLADKRKGFSDLQITPKGQIFVRGCGSRVLEDFGEAINLRNKCIRSLYAVNFPHEDQTGFSIYRYALSTGVAVTPWDCHAKVNRKSVNVPLYNKLFSPKCCKAFRFSLQNQMVMRDLVDIKMDSKIVPSVLRVWMNFSVDWASVSTLDSKVRSAFPKLECKHDAIPDDRIFLPKVPRVEKEKVFRPVSPVKTHHQSEDDEPPKMKPITPNEKKFVNDVLDAGGSDFEGYDPSDIIREREEKRKVEEEKKAQEEVLRQQEEVDKRAKEVEMKLKEEEMRKKFEETKKFLEQKALQDQKDEKARSDAASLALARLLQEKEDRKAAVRVQSKEKAREEVKNKVVKGKKSKSLEKDREKEKDDEDVRSPSDVEVDERLEKLYPSSFKAKNVGRCQSKSICYTNVGGEYLQDLDASEGYVEANDGASAGVKTACKHIVAKVREIQRKTRVEPSSAPASNIINFLKKKDFDPSMGAWGVRSSSSVIKGEVPPVTNLKEIPLVSESMRNIYRSGLIICRLPEGALIGYAAGAEERKVVVVPLLRCTSDEKAVALVKYLVYRGFWRSRKVYKRLYRELTE